MFARRVLPETLKRSVQAENERLEGAGRVLVRPSGTEPLVRILAEAERAEDAQDLCATMAALVEREIGSA